MSTPKKTTPFLRDFWTRGMPLKALLGLLLATVSLSCAPRLLQPMNIGVSLAADLNSDQPLAVDMIVVCRDSRKTAFQTMTVKDWFASRQDYLNPDFKDPDISVYSWEWVPGQELPEGVTIDSHKSCTIYVFANYASEEKTKAVMKGKAPFVLHFDRENFTSDVPSKKKKKSLWRRKTL